MSTSPSAEARTALLARAWDDAASGYDAYFVPRFAPWLEEAIAALDADLPPGAIAVPCCGTGPELSRMAARFPERPLLGVDLSPKMVELARRRLGDREGVRLEVKDATSTEGWPRIAAVVSFFGLQQMPDPRRALQAWTEALEPAGVLSVTYWPREVEQDGPFAWMWRALDDRPAAYDGWEEDLAGVVTRAGGELQEDAQVQHGMAHESAEVFWDAAMGSGPGRALVLARGEAYVAERRAAFLEIAPAGPLEHRPRARRLVARKAR